MSHSNMPVILLLQFNVLSSWVRHISQGLDLHTGLQFCTGKLTRKTDQIVEVAYDELEPVHEEVQYH